MMANEIRRSATEQGVLLVGLFFVIFLEAGIMKSFGVLSQDIADNLGMSMDKIGFAVGLWEGITYMAVPLYRPLQRILSSRQIVMFGGLIGSLSIIAITFSQTGAQFICFTVISGLGYGLTFFFAQSGPVEYFPDRFDVASSIILTGGGVGLMVMPVVTEKLQAIYGWRGALLLVAGFGLHITVSGALMKPVKTPSPSDDSSSAADGRASSSEDEPKSHEKQTDSSGDQLSFSHGRDFEISPSPSGCNANFTDKSLNSASVVRRPDPEMHLGNSPKTRWEVECHADPTITDEHESQNSRLSRHQSNSAHSEKTTVPSEASDRLLLEEMCETDSLNTSGGDSVNSDLLTPMKYIWRFVKYLFAVDVLRKDPVGIMSIFLLLLLTSGTYTCWTVFVVQNGISKGYSPAQAVLLATAGGAANVVGRMCIGIWNEKQFITSYATTAILALISAAAFIINNFRDEYGVLVFLSVINGGTLGCRTVMENTLCNDIAPPGNTREVMMVVFITTGPGHALAGYLIGLFYSRTGSYDASFILIGCADILSAVVILVPLVSIYYRKLMTSRTDQRRINTPTIAPHTITTLQQE